MHVPASARDEEDAGVAQILTPAIVAVALVEDQDGALREGELAGAHHVVDAALGHHGEGRQQAVVIKPEMQLHRRLAERVMRPGKQAQRQVDERTVEGVELVLEAEAVARRLALAARVELGEQRLIERVGLGLVDPGQG